MSKTMNKYWMPNYMINKNVITRELQLYLGPEASVRSYSRQGQEGFLISTPGPCITDEQINDIREKSRKEWEKYADSRLKAEGTTYESTSKQLKCPINQPVLVSNASDASDSSYSKSPASTWSQGSGRRDDERRRSDDYYSYGYDDYDRRSSDEDRRSSSRRDDDRRRRPRRDDYGRDHRR